jgi:dihydroneopterin aldolase
MAVRLEVEGIRAVARLGVSLEERSLPQPVELGVVLWLREEPQHDSLEDTVDYSVLDAVVPRVLAEEHRLVEQLAAHLADAVLAALDGAR